MIEDPYKTLGLTNASDQETIRKAYLRLIKEFSPEKHPAKFSEIRAAYEILMESRGSVYWRLFEDGRNDSIEAILKELTCRMTRHRKSLKTLLANRVRN